MTGSETEALAMGDRVVVLDRGRIAQFGKPDEVYGRPASPNVAHFLNRYNIFAGELKGGTFTGPFGVIGVSGVTPSEKPAYAIRYDRMKVEPAGASVSGPSIPATFVASEYLGSSVIYFFEAADGQVIEVEHHLSLGAPQSYETRGQYLLRWKPEDAIVFGQG